MKLETAIQVLKTDLIVPGSVDKPHFQEAERLGKEALWRYLHLRQAGVLEALMLLPGETKD